ncbi:SusC/RagA family TonB-linked outer membrane protein [Pedobacter sp. HMF7647]|uniref:SusC/RagA family TonB-linked outer membrane protein n=1 Tax=Hufsiella arboris TaxID=2695275 RepID=A0A7K1Y8T8_9SPHI|nr:SusC/RagA family TonB-linked outer membrane protein [Hufsiella arboris]MXV50995.1 SusC/RagA family TonB-linked outer membrane protein [Hufsiella arboris]
MKFLRFAAIAALHAIVLPAMAIVLTVPSSYAGIKITYENSGTWLADITVKGKITDENGEILPGVSIKVEGGTKGAVSDVNGNYSITVPNDAVLVYSYIGYVTQKIAVNSQATLNVRLKADANNQLNEVVVVAYGTQKKATISGAISNIRSEDIVRTPAVAATSALVGKVPGVTARTMDSRPGNGASLQIRNLGNPLYVIDGVAYSTSNGTDAFGYNTGISGVNAFNQLGLDDIESITVLKDASASIYGLAAGNGVVLVTTKKGKKGDKPALNVNSYYGLQNFTRFPYPGNAAEYVRGRLESEQNLGRNPALLYSPEEYAKWQAGTEPGYQSNDYYKFVTRPNVPQYSLNANASGSTEKSSYYLSVGHLNQDAIIKDFNFNRTNIQANLSSTILKGFTVGAQLSGRVEKRHNVGVPGLDDYFNPLLSIGSMWPTETAYANNNPAYINQTHNVNVNPATYTNDITGYIDDVTRGAGAKLNAQYDFKFGLSIKGLYSYDYYNEDFDGFEYTYPAYIFDPTTGKYNDRAPNGALYGNQNPWREKHKRNVISEFSQLQVSYAKQLGDHNISALAAAERRESSNDYIALHSVPPNNIITTQLFADLDYLGDSHYEEAFEGYAMRLNYDYKKKYLLEGVARVDGSFLYQGGSRYGFFPGVSAGWRISQERFFLESIGKVVNELKFRVSYGETGTSLQDGNGNYYSPSPFAYLGGYNTNAGNAVFDGIYYNGVQPRGLPTTNLSWIRNRMANIGIDFTVVKHITGQFDVFQRKRSGFPAARYDVVLPSEVGYALPQENLNSDITRGLDGFITYSNTIGQVDFSIGGNATLGRTKNDYIYKPRFGNSYDQYRNNGTDRWQAINWGHHIIGQFKSQQEINDYPVNIDGQGNRTLLPGDLIYEDLNGDGIINNLDQKPIGYAEGALPYFNYGVNARVSWKGISLIADFAGAGMQTYFRDWELKYPFQNNGNSPAYMLNDRWHQADPYNPASEWIPGTYPALRKDNTGLSIFRSPLDGNDRNDFWTTNIRYFRLKNLELGYSFPKKLISKVHITALRVYANGSNLFSFDNVKDYQIDPEIASTNGLVYPQQKIYTFGFNLTL